METPTAFAGPEVIRESLWNRDTARSDQAEAVICAHQDESDAWLRSLDPAEQKAIDAYVGMEYRAINGGLRVGLVDELVPVIDAALAKAPIGEPVVRYRGVSFFGQEASSFIDKTYKVGTTVHFPSFLSTSDDPISAAEFALGGDDGFVLEILTDKGAPVIDHMHPDEFERLLPRDLSFEVVEIRQDIEFKFEHTDLPQTITVVRLVEVED